MDKKEYKKALVDMRNNYLDYKRILNAELKIILGISFLRQKQYLDCVTFNMISSDSIIKSNIGNFIAYGIFRKSTTKNLIEISSKYFEEYEKTCKELKKIDKEFDKICIAIDFIDSVNDSELEKYLSYKIN